MKITQILKKLTPERIQKEVEAIQKVKLPPELQKWVKEYEKVGERDEFLWKWLYKMFQAVQLPIVLPRCQKSLLEIKVLVTMFVSQLDDVADKTQDQVLLDELLKIPFSQKYINYNSLPLKKKDYLIFTKKLWSHITKRTRRYPKYKILREIFEYDMRQVLNTMRYSYLINKNPDLINRTECWLYTPYNMVSLIYSGLDLMCSFGVNFRKIGKIREIILAAQKMARIGNWISTWEREIEENDFTSGIFIYAVDLGVVTVDELTNRNKSTIIKKIKNKKIKEKLLLEWEQCYQLIKGLGSEMKEESFANKFLFSMEKLIIFHLSSKGYK